MPSIVETASPMRVGLRRLRWITIAVPVAALALVMYLMAFALPAVFQTPAGYVVAVALVLIAVAGFSTAVFVVIERLEQRLTRQNARLQVAASVALALTEPGEQSAIIDRVLDGIVEPLQADAALIRLVDTKTDTYVETARGLGVVTDPTASVIPPDLDGAILVDDAALQPPLKEVAGEGGFRCLMMAPLVAHGSTEGAMLLASCQPGRFNEEDRLLLDQVARQIGLATQRSGLLEELVDRNNELRILNDHAAALSAAGDLPAVLDVVLRTLMRISASEEGQIWLDEDGTLELVHHIDSAAAPEPAEVPSRLQDEADLDVQDRLARVRRSGAPLFDRDERIVRGHLPLRSGGRVLGVVRLVRPLHDGWSGRRQRLLGTLADQGGVAVSDACQRGRARAFAVLEERGRIAREMHDGLAQVLGYLNTKSSAIRLCLDHGDTPAASSLLADLEEAARDASEDVRESVLALRSSEHSDGDLFGDVAAYVGKFQRMSGIPVDCRVPPDRMAPQPSQMVEIQVMRLIQEALSNVRKHAGATRATVSIMAASDSLDIHIDDDGRGFDTELAAPSDQPSFGLQTMRERAEAVGGRFSVASAPGEGTHISARVPVGRSSASPA